MQYILTQEELDGYVTKAELEKAHANYLDLDITVRSLWEAIEPMITGDQFNQLCEDVQKLREKKLYAEAQRKLSV